MGRPIRAGKGIEACQIAAMAGRSQTSGQSREFLKWEWMFHIKPSAEHHPGHTVLRDLYGCTASWLSPFAAALWPGRRHPEAKLERIFRSDTSPASACRRPAQPAGRTSQACVRFQSGARANAQGRRTARRTAQGAAAPDRIQRSRAVALRPRRNSCLLQHHRQRSFA